jgi:hypothetical protein
MRTKMKFKILVIDCMRGVRKYTETNTLPKQQQGLVDFIRENRLMFNRAIEYNDKI